MATSASRTAPARQRWADVGKGAGIVLVVLWHVTRKDYLQLPWHLAVPVSGAWGTFSEVLLPVRMPLFFFVSGLFAVRVVRRPWPQVWTGRVAPVLWLFVLWTLVHTLVLRLTPGFDTAVAGDPVALLVQLTITPGNLWFLLALGVYTAVARATRAAPGLALTAALALSAVASAGLVPTPGNRMGLLTNLVWFLLGVHGVARPRRAPGSQRVRPSPTAPLPVVVLLVVGFAVGAGLWQGLDADAWFGVGPLLGLLGVLSGVAVSGAVARTARLGPALAWIGRRTLPVCVLHLPLVALVHLVSARLVVGRPASSVVLAAVYPVVVTTAVVVICLVLQRLVASSPAWWLLAAPWRGRPARLRAASAAVRVVGQPVQPLVEQAGLAGGQGIGCGCRELGPEGRGRGGDLGPGGTGSRDVAQDGGVDDVAHPGREVLGGVQGGEAHQHQRRPDVGRHDHLGRQLGRDDEQAGRRAAVEHAAQQPDRLRRGG